jgi:hypothetical protein
LGPVAAGIPLGRPIDVLTEKLDISFLTSPWQIGQFTLEL